MSNNSASNNSSVKSFINGLLKYDSFIVFGGMGLVIIAVIMVTVLFEKVDSMRTNVLFNNAIAIAMGIFFIYLVFTFMGQYVTIFKVKIDFGLILFLLLGIIIIFVLGD